MCMILKWYFNAYRAESIARRLYRKNKNRGVLARQGLGLVFFLGILIGLLTAAKINE